MMRFSGELFWTLESWAGNILTSLTTIRLSRMVVIHAVSYWGVIIHLYSALLFFDAMSILGVAGCTSGCGLSERY